MWWVKYTDGVITSASPSWWEGVDTEIATDDPALLEFLHPTPKPATSPLTPDQFYTMLDNEAQLDAFIAAIETVTPTSKKLTCRNQFNNAQEFTWEMIVVTLVMPKVYGVDWQTIVAPIWVNAYQTLLAAAPTE